MNRASAAMIRGLMRFGPGLLPFADAATAELPMGRLLRLSLFQVTVGMAAVLLIVAMLMVTRVKDFSWNAFSRVGRWALLAYCVSAGMIEFAFVHNDAPDNVLKVVTGMLVIFALDVPFLIATTVARYHTD